MGIISPYATAPGPIYYGSGYVSRKDFWTLGLIFGAIYLAVLLLIGVLIFASTWGKAKSALGLKCAIIDQRTRAQQTASALFRLRDTSIRNCTESRFNARSLLSSTGNQTFLAPYAQLPGWAR